jgi:hypothetical protein
MYNPELQDVTNKLQRAQLMLSKAMAMNPKTDMARELQEGRIAIAYAQVTSALCDVDDFNTLN